MKHYIYRLATDEIATPCARAARGVLASLSLCYRMGVAVMRLLYAKRILRTYRVSLPVISVGNITLGGAGKTPLVALLIERLRQKNITPAILMRGYMAQKNVSGAALLNDEGLMLRGMFPLVPVLCGVNRVVVARQAVAQHAGDVLVLDDGFQHWRLFRDINIVVIDAMQPFGNGWLLPRGILREPVQALTRADIIVVSRVDMGSDNVDAIRKKITAVNPTAPIVEAIHQPVGLRDIRTGEKVKQLSALTGIAVCLMSSIGNPGSFVKTVAGLGADVREAHTFMDHHQYRVDDLKKVANLCRERGIDTIVVTEKDAVKVGPFTKDIDSAVAVYSLIVRMKIVRGEDAFFSRIDSLFPR